MLYSLTFEVSELPWSGAGDQGPAGFRRPSRLNLLLKGVDANGQSKEVLVGIDGGNPLKLDQGETYSFAFEAEALAEIRSFSLQFDQASADLINLNSLAIQSLDGLNGSLLLSEVIGGPGGVASVRRVGEGQWTAVAPILQGLQVDLYDGRNFDKLTNSRVDAQVAIDDAYGRRYNNGDSDTFSALLVGEIQATSNGRNQWQLRADDGVRLWIGDKLLVNAWKDQAATWYAFSVDGLTKDEWYPIRIEYYENRGNAELKLADASRKLLSSDQLRVKPQSSWQTIQGLHGTLRVDRQGNYLYEPDSFDPDLQSLSPGVELVESFELQVLADSGEAATTRIDISLTGGSHAPFIAIDFQKDAFELIGSSGIQRTYINAKAPLAIGDSSAIELRPFTILGGDNDRLATEYGNVWFHVLAADGTRLPDNAQTIDPDLPTFFIIHGFLAGVGDGWLNPLRHGFENTNGDWRLKPEDRLPWMTQYEPGHGLALSLLDLYRQDPDQVAANVVLVDWGNFSGSGPDYLKTARDHVPAVGQAIADYLLNHNLDPTTTTLIGHSLGGHISGFAGQAVQRMAADGQFAEGTKLGRIIGMDAAGPLFNGRGPSSRLSPNDATDVFNLHTSDSFGFDAPLAKYDLYVNSEYAIKSPYSYDNMAALADLGWPAFFGAIGLNSLFNPSSVAYQYDFTLDIAGGLANFVSGIDSHSYAVAFLAALMHEDLRITQASGVVTPPGYQLVDSDNNPIGFYDRYWGNTFGIELKKLQAANDERVSQGLLPLTFKTLLLGADQGGIFGQVEQPSWLPDSASAALPLDWDQDGRNGFGFLSPDQAPVSGDVPFSDYLLYWDNDAGPVDVDLSAYNWLISPDFESDYLNGWTAYGPSPTIEAGLLEFGQALADLWSAAEDRVEEVVEVVNQVADGVGVAVNAAVSAIRSGWRWVFGGPVIYGDVFFDERQYNAEGEIVKNSNLRPEQGEPQTKTDSFGRYTIGELSDPKLFGNGNSILDYRDGLMVAGAINEDGSVSLYDSISGANMGFPLVGLPGGSITLLTTLKYAALLRWRTQWDNLRIPVTPENITSYYGSLIANTPRAFYDDNYTPYSELSSDDPEAVSEAIDNLEFTYGNLAIVKSIMELLRNFRLDYSNSLAWGAATQALDPKGSDRVEITAFSAYGFAMGQRFGQNIALDSGLIVNPGDSVVGRLAIAPQFDLGNQFGVRQLHLRELIKEVLAVYPTEQLLADAPVEVWEAYRDGRSLEESKIVDGYIEAKLGDFLDRYSLGLDIMLDAVHTRISTAEELGSEFVIPGIAGPKRLVLNSLASDLVDHALGSSTISEFLSQYLVSFYTPETIDAADRAHPFSISISASSSEPVAGAAWDSSQGSLLMVHLLLTDEAGEPQSAPDQGLAIRMRFGGSIQEGIHYFLPADLDDRTFYLRGGETQGSFAIQLAPGEIPAGSNLSIELLSADSGYAPAHDNAVLNVSLVGGDVAISGTRKAFHPYQIANAVELNAIGAAAVEPVSTPQLLMADAAVPNVVLRGVDGRVDYFLMGVPDYGLPHIENFKPEDGDKVLIDRSQFVGSGRDPLIEDFNTYAGLVFDLVEARPLALISDYSTAAGDRAWAGLSSSAGFYRFATQDELELAGALTTSVNRQPERGGPDPIPSEVALPVLNQQTTPPERGGVVPEAIAVIGRSSVVVRGAEKELEVRSGEMGLGSGRKDVLMAVVMEGEEKQPVLLSAGGGRDVYGVADGGMTVIADGGGGKGDVVTGLAGDVSEWSWREIGGDGDVLLVGGEKGERTRVLLIDPLGEGDRANRIERMEIGGERLAVERALGEMEQRKRLGYGELNQRRGGVLGDVLGLSGKEGRGELVEVLRSNLQIVQEPPFG